MNITKEMMKISMLFGIITGVIALIPPFIFYSLLILFLFASIAVVLYYRRIEKFELTDSKDTALKGGIIGFISFLSYIAVFVPCVLVLSFIFKGYYNYGLPYFLSLQAFWLFILILVVVGIICAVTNGVTLMGLQSVELLRKGK